MPTMSSRSRYQIAVPFYVSSRGYGFLWNAPGEGTFDSTDNATAWASSTQRQLDFWVVAPAAMNSSSSAAPPIAGILSRYADATGHAPLLPRDRMGFWQSKMRYRSSDELVDIAQGFADRQVPSPSPRHNHRDQSSVLTEIYLPAYICRRRCRCLN
jgi:alpha-D-xyloside xylohydrolase